MGTFLAALGTKLAEREMDKKTRGGGKRGAGGGDASQYSPGSMGLTGSIPGQEADLGDNSSTRRKRTNGKRQ